MNLKDEFLSCALFTITPQAPYYKCMGDFTTTQNGFYTIHDPTFFNFYVELNNHSTRRIAKKILQPLLETTTSRNFCKTSRIKRYLKKFKRNYYGYFSKNVRVEKNPISSKALNTNAIEALFLLAGL